MAVGIASAAGPLTSAKLTRMENSVKFGEVKGNESVTRPAAVNDVVKEQNFLLTENDSRAELQYEDGSVVRVGQNTVFSFEANSRTLSLAKGTFIFYVPRGQGGTIKTPSLTAAITGTLGKVSRNTIAILQGEITLVPSGRKVKAGEFARMNADGSIFIGRFDPARAGDGELMAFNGPMPGFNENLLLPGRRVAQALSELDHFNQLDRVQNQPSRLREFYPFDRPRNNPKVPPPPTDKPVQPPY